MQYSALEPRPLYAIGTVARLTGLKPDTLRIWERRYGLGASRKSSTGRRQYTQSDLEHLQLIAALGSSGSRIGEIAAAPRKTLELLLRGRGKSAAEAIPAAKPRVVCIGEKLCEWLDEHQGCLANVDALLARFALTESLPDKFENIDTLMVECGTLGNDQLAKIKALAAQLAPKNIVVMYQFCNERWLQEVESQNITAILFPPDPAYLAFELGRRVAGKATDQGTTNLGDLVTAKPRHFTSRELTAARQLQASIDCECPRHLTDLIRALAQFEEYSASCSVENWHDAAIHSCIYAYTGQARWLMEKALDTVLEEHQVEFSRALQRPNEGNIDDVA
jgi:DNA-binding transcriptional MerR regulator